MAITAAVDNAAETSGDLNKEAWDKYNLLRSAVLVEHDTDGTHLSTGGVVLKALFDANTILAADADDTPAALTVAASCIIGRASTGNIAALTAAQVNTILSTATKALDNLASVAINTSLISDTDNTDDLGSSTKEWKDLYIDGTANIDVMAPFTMTGSGAKLIDISGAATTAQIYIGGTAILASGEEAIYVNCPSETAATNAVWLTLGSTVTSGDLTGVRSRVTGNATSAGASVRGGYLEAKGGAGKYAAMLEGSLSHADYSAGSVTVSGDVRGFTAHISQGSGLNAANLYGGLISIQTRGDETITTDDVGVMIRNEAVGGNGRTMDAGFKLADLNMGGGTNGFTYGIDLNGVGIATADIRFSGGQVITSSASALTLPAFTLGGKLTGGASEIEGTGFDINGGTIGGVTLDGAIAGGDQAFTGVGDMTFTAGSILKSGGTNADTLLLAANDTTFITLTTNVADTCAISGAAIDNCIIGAGTAAALTCTTFTSTGIDDNADANAITISAGGVLTLPGQSLCRAYLDTSAQVIPTASLTHMTYNAEAYDVQNEFDSSRITGIADATEANKLHDDDGGFSASDVGKTVWNTTDNTYTIVSGYVDSGELNLTDDIMANGEGYILYFSRFTAKKAGKYLVIATSRLLDLGIDKRFQTYICKNGVSVQVNRIVVPTAGDAFVQNSVIVSLAVDDYIHISCYHDHGSTRNIEFGEMWTSVTIVKIV